MKRLQPAHWFGPSYSYSYQKGITRHRSGRRCLFLTLGFSVLAVLWLSGPQLKDMSRPSQANLSAHSSDPKPVVQAAIAAPAVTTVNLEDPALDSIISAFAAAHPTYNWSVSVQGLGSDGRSAAYGPQTKYSAASLYKLLLLYPLAQKLPFNQWPNKNLAVNDNSKSIADCVTAMLKVSDNDCGDAVGNYVGWANADAQLRSIGLSGTQLNNASGPTTTAADMTFFLQGLYQGKWFDGTAGNFITNTLQGQIYRSGIPAGCSSSCIVADKVGDLGSVRHDAGIVEYPDGAYVLTIMTSGASYAQIADLAGQIQAHMATQD